MIATNNIKNIGTRYSYKLCIIRDRGGDMNKRWYVEFYVWDIAVNKMVRRVDYSFNHQPTPELRMRMAKQIADEIDRLLLNGYYFNSADIPIKEVPEVKHSIESGIKMAYESRYNKVSDSSKLAYRSVYRNWCIYASKKGINKLHLSKLDKHIINGYFEWLINEHKTKDDLPISARTFNYYRLHFKMWLSALEMRDLVPQNNKLMMISPKRKVDSTTHRVYSDALVVKIITHLRAKSPQLALLVQFIYYLFVRPNEARFLQVKHIKADNKLHIPAYIDYKGKRIGVSKTGVNRYPVIPKPLQVELAKFNFKSMDPEAFIFGKESNQHKTFLSHAAWAFRYSAAIKEMNLPSGYTLYGWKHTGACKLYMATKDPVEVQTQCGHKNLQTTIIYLRDLGMFMNSDVEDLFPAI
jgi:integrase